MKLLKLVIVDDEPILLEGLLKTYDWGAMGFAVAGSAGSGEEAMQVIREIRPHVVLTDIRMKQITGLQVMEEMEKEGIESLFVVLSAYRDFEYAQQACDLGAYAYLLKPIEDEKLTETMKGAWEFCMKQIKEEEKIESWENLLVKDSDSFLQVTLQKYIQNSISREKLEEVFAALETRVEQKDKFIAVCADLDLAYKITNTLGGAKERQTVLQAAEKRIREETFCWRIEDGDGVCVFIAKTKDNRETGILRRAMDQIKKEGHPLVAAVSKPYAGIAGIRKSYDEAKELFRAARSSGAGVFAGLEETEEGFPEGSRPADEERQIISAVRRNDREGLKEAYIRFLYRLPAEESKQVQYLHKVMLRVEFVVQDSYGMTEELKAQFKSYYCNLQNLSAAKAVDVCYKILCRAIEVRTAQGPGHDTRGFKEYMSTALAYIDDHLDDEELSIVSVAEHVYLNPVYFGRVFKNTFQMTFKKYLMKRRMERAKSLLEEGHTSIGGICEMTGINNPSYFSHLFKEYTGKLPSEYRKEYES